MEKEKLAFFFYLFSLFPSRLIKCVRLIQLANSFNSRLQVYPARKEEEIYIGIFSVNQFKCATGEGGEIRIAPLLPGQV